MKKLLYGLLTLAILIGSAYAVAAGPGPGGPGGPLLGRLLALKLTEAQKHDVAVILKKNRPAFQSAMEATREAFGSMRDVMRNDPGNEQLVRQASRKVAAAGEELAVLRGKAEAQALAVLTPEQRKQWQEAETGMDPRAKERFDAGRELVDTWIDAHAGQDS
jgi:Spy/CpxP family protein refolding chaperone